MNVSPMMLGADKRRDGTLKIWHPFQKLSIRVLDGAARKENRAQERIPQLPRPDSESLPIDLAQGSSSRKTIGNPPELITGEVEKLLHCLQGHAPVSSQTERSQHIRGLRAYEFMEEGQ